MEVEVIIPVLDEEETLNSQILKIAEYLREINNNDSTVHYYLTIADNGSKDSTAEIARNLAAQIPNLIKFHQVGERGVGLALKSSWSASTADIVGYMDLDLATDIKHLPQAISMIKNKNCDVVYGSRLHKNSKVIGRTLKREITSRIFNLILKVYLSTRISDGMCGFKFLKRQHLDTLMNNGAISNGWFFCTEILVVADWKNLKLGELPVTWTDDINSKVNILKLSIEYLKAMNTLKRNHS